MLNDNRQHQAFSSSSESGGARAFEGAPSKPAEPAPAQNPPEDYLKMKDWIRRIQSDTEHARTVAEQTKEDQKDLQHDVQSLSRKSKHNSLATLFLVLTLCGASAYGYFALQDQSALLSQLPSLQQLATSMSQRIDATETSLHDWTDKWTAIGERVAHSEKTSAANLQASKNYTLEQTANVHHQVQKELDNRSQSTDANLNQIRTAQLQDRETAENLQKEVSQWKQESGRDVALVREEVARGRNDLTAQIVQNRRDMEDVHYRLDRRRVDFEIRKDQTLEVIPGITMTVSETNVSYQRIEGRIHLLRDGRILWVRGQGIQQPATFYTREDDRPYQIVFTRVAKDSVVGFVLLPGRQT